MAIEDKAGNDRYNEDLEKKLTEAAALEKTGNFELAELIYTEVISICPALPYAYAKRGFSKEKQKKYREAVADYSIAISKKPNSPVTIWRRAISYEYLDLLDPAERDYLRYMELKGPDADAFLAMSFIRSYLGDSQKALEYCENAAKLDPNNEEVKSRLRTLKNENRE